MQCDCCGMDALDRSAEAKGRGPAALPQCQPPASASASDQWTLINARQLAHADSAVQMQCRARVCVCNAAVVVRQQRPARIVVQGKKTKERGKSSQGKSARPANIQPTNFLTHAHASYTAQSPHNAEPDRHGQPLRDQRGWTNERQHDDATTHPGLTSQRQLDLVHHDHDHNQPQIPVLRMRMPWSWRKNRNSAARGSSRRPCT